MKDFLPATLVGLQGERQIGAPGESIQLIRCVHNDVEGAQALPLLGDLHREGDGTLVARPQRGGWRTTGSVEGPVCDAQNINISITASVDRSGEHVGAKQEGIDHARAASEEGGWWGRRGVRGGGGGGGRRGRRWGGKRTRNSSCI